MRDHRGGIEADLVGRLGIAGLEAVPSTIGWDGLFSFAAGLGEDSATFASMHPDLAPWATRLRLAQVLTDLYDLVAVMNANMVGYFSRRRAPQLKPYPRPWAKGAGVKRYGRGAIPIRDFEAWYYGETEMTTG